MDNNDWSLERWRIIAILFFSFCCGLFTGQWLLSLVVVLIGYIVWLLYKLKQLHEWFSSDAKPSTLPDSNGIWESITEEVQLMHKKSNHRKERMSSVLNRMQGIITGLPYATVVLNENNEIDWANDLSSKYLDIDSKRDHGQGIDTIIRLPKLQEILQDQSRKEIEINLATGEYGLERQLAIQIIPIEDDLKLMIARDISERNSINRMRKNFIANASHELRTPLTVIAGYLEIMREDQGLAENLKPAVHSASEQSERMQSIINDLLILSRLENTELNDDSNHIIDVPSILKSICTEEKALIKNNSHTIKTDIDTTLKIKGSEAEIVSVCSNLIHNSVRHTKEGSTIKVEWKLSQNNKAYLSIKDNGQGIPAEHIAHLTERFYRVDKGRSRDKGGTGLGLAIVQHIVQRHNGKLDISSEMGVGSEFVVNFPKSRVYKPAT